MLKTLVVAIDNWQEIEGAVAHAEALAAAFSARVILLGIMSEGQGSEFTDPVLWSVTRRESQATLNEYMHYLQANNIDASTQIIETPSIEKVFRCMAEVDCSLIVVPNSRYRDSWLSESILRHSHIPVFLARGDGLIAQYKNILVPLDGSQRAESSLNLALTLAETTGARLHLAHVVQQPEMPRKMQASAQDLEMARRLTRRNAEEAKFYMEQVVAKLRQDIKRHTLISRKVSASLHKLIDQENISLLVMSAHGYSGEAQWPLGSVAENMVRYGRVPTIVVQDLPAYLERPQPNEARLQTGAK